MSDRASEIIKRGDPEEILRMAFGARMAAESGEFCECEEPSVHGLDLMCGHCLYENQGQIERRERAMREPHEFQGRSGEQLCRLCAGWEDDPRHV